MRPKRQYKCSGCHQKHEKPTGRNCQFLAVAPEDDQDSDQDQQIDASDDALDDAQQDSASDDDQIPQDAISPGVGAQILQTLQSMDSRLQGLESRVSSNAAAIKRMSNGGG